VSGSGSNAKVMIAGMGNNSLVASREPLYVIDNVRIRSLAQASNLVQTSNIKTVRVLKSASETSFYGSAGANGVIVIKLKKK
jgi:TonB-dependent SusC/RagA subfamily outer membrane receptor